MKRQICRITIRVHEDFYIFWYFPEDEEALVDIALNLVEDQRLNFDFPAFRRLLRAAKKAKILSMAVPTAPSKAPA